MTVKNYEKESVERPKIEKLPPLMINPYEYRRVNFLNEFRKMGFEFLEYEPTLLVKKVLSIDPDWIGHVNYERYGNICHFGENSRFMQSPSTKVPCLEGEWVLVCYGKDHKTLGKNGESYSYSRVWNRYYVCQIDFSQESLFRIVEDFEKENDAFEYICDNKLVPSMKDESDREKMMRQESAYYAHVALSILSEFENEPSEFTMWELRKFISKNSECEEIYKIVDYSLRNKDKKRKDLTPSEIEELKYRKVAQHLPHLPYQIIGFDNKLTIKQYLDMVREFRDNYLWNL